MTREEAIEKLEKNNLAISEYAISLLINTAKLKDMCVGGDTQNTTHSNPKG